MSYPLENANELDALDPVPDRIKLQSGLEVEFEDLRTRQFFKLLRILTHGALPMLGGSSDLLTIRPGDSADELGGKLLAMVVMAVPDAEDEALEFVKAMIRPVGLRLRRGLRMNKQDQEWNDQLWAQVDIELDNPELEDLLSILEGVINREKEDLAALGKRIMAMLNLAEKTGQLPPNLPSPSLLNDISSEDSAEPGTSSSPSTEATTTINVESSLLNGPDRSSQPSESVDGPSPTPVSS